MRPVCVWLLEREGREGEGLRGKRRSEEEEVGKKEGKKKKKKRPTIDSSLFLFLFLRSSSPIKCPTGAEMTVAPAIVPRSLTLKLETIVKREKERERKR